MIGRVFLAVTSALFAFAAAADVRFTIERIEVRNARRISPELIAAETLLGAGSEVTENDVRAAVRRLGRLPFLYSAEYTLEPGSDDTRRVLAITVRENARFWFLVDARGTQVHEPVDMFDYDYVDPTAEWKHSAAGVRWLFGDGGVAHFAMTVLRNRRGFGKNYSAYELGYTRHRIAGTRLFATVIARSPVDSLEQYTFSPEVVVGLPLNGDQTLTLEYEDTIFSKSKFRIDGATFSRGHTERTLSAAWTFDTRNEPYMPMQGTFLRVEPLYWMSDQGSFSGRPGQFEGIGRHLNAAGVEVTAERHWQLSEVHSVSAGFLGGWSTLTQRTSRVGATDLRSRPSYELVKAGYARKIYGSYVEVEGRALFRQLGDDERDDFGFDRSSFEVAASWARRTPRATLRLGLMYTD